MLFTTRQCLRVLEGTRTKSTFQVAALRRSDRPSTNGLGFFWSKLQFHLEVCRCFYHSTLEYWPWGSSAFIIVFFLGPIASQQSIHDRRSTTALYLPAHCRIIGEMSLYFNAVPSHQSAFPTTATTSSKYAAANRKETTYTTSSTR